MSTPNTVSFVTDSLFRKLTWAARVGALADIQVSPPQFSTIDIKDLFVKPLQVADGGGAFSIVVINSLDKPLKKVTEYFETGQQTGYPALTDFGKHATRPDEIPAAMPDPNNPGNTLHGLGLYTYDTTPSSFAVYFSCKGALVLSTGDADSNIAIRWQTAWGWIHPTVAVSANYTDDYKDLQDFYSNVADSQGPLLSASTKAKAFASMIWRRDSFDPAKEYGYIVVWVTDPATV
jgi:hypothetical protein